MGPTLSLFPEYPAVQYLLNDRRPAHSPLPVVNQIPLSFSPSRVLKICTQHESDVLHNTVAFISRHAGRKGRTKARRGPELCEQSHDRPRVVPTLIQAGAQTRQPFPRCLRKTQGSRRTRSEVGNVGYENVKLIHGSTRSPASNRASWPHKCVSHEKNKAGIGLPGSGPSIQKKVKNKNYVPKRYRRKGAWLKLSALPLRSH